MSRVETEGTPDNYFDLVARIADIEAWLNTDLNADTITADYLRRDLEQLISYDISADDAVDEAATCYDICCGMLMRNFKLVEIEQVA